MAVTEDTATDRAARALTDVVAVERVAPGLVRVVSWSDAYMVDARDAGCRCPDQEYNLAPNDRCKHEHAALLTDVDHLPTPFEVSDNLRRRAAADGGERPDDCECAGDDLPCAACYISGFDDPNPDQ